MYVPLLKMHQRWNSGFSWNILSKLTRLMAMIVLIMHVWSCDRLVHHRGTISQKGLSRNVIITRCSVSHSLFDYGLMTDVTNFVNPKLDQGWPHWAILVPKLDQHTDGLVQERRNSSALAMELHLSCTNPLIHWYDKVCYLGVVLFQGRWYHSTCSARSSQAAYRWCSDQCIGKGWCKPTGKTSVLWWYTYWPLGDVAIILKV